MYYEAAIKPQIHQIIRSAQLCVIHALTETTAGGSFFSFSSSFFSSQDAAAITAVAAITITAAAVAAEQKQKGLPYGSPYIFYTAIVTTLLRRFVRIG